MAREIGNGRLILEDGTIFTGSVFACPRSVAGEVVFNTGMVGYPETLTDPSYRGQILVLTYPLIGNYGVPPCNSNNGLSPGFESERIQIEGLVVSSYTPHYSHWSASRSLGDWLTEHHVPALQGVDTRALTKHLREKGTMLGKILASDDALPFRDPNVENLVSSVSLREPDLFQGGAKKVVVVDCGCKHSIIRRLRERGLTVLRVPWDHDFLAEDFDGLVISNGPGDPKTCAITVDRVRAAMERKRPIFGICLGHQILALAAGADTYKLKFGHRSQNQPCVESSSGRCYITSQNHGYAVDPRTLPTGWEPWFTNANDGTNEGIQHTSLPFMGVQFHPEAAPGPVDTHFLFDEFVTLL